MEPARERAAISSPSRNVLLLSPVVAVVFMTTCAATATCAAPSAAAAAAAPSARAEAWRHTPRTSFVPNPHRRLGYLRHRRPSFDSVQAVRPGKEGASKRGRIAVDADSWYLGDGGFADRHLDDEEHIAAKKTEKEFFRKRSLSVYDQMKEASMLLLAQQQVLAAEEEREEASKPRFVAAKGGTQAARAQAIRDRRKKREAVAGLLPEPPGTAAATATAGETGASKSGSAAAAAAGEGGRGLAVPAGEGALSGESLGVGGLDEELEEIRRRVCIPLAAPADLLEDLGISPVRGMLLHGPPGCGKTLLARRLSATLTPRPPTVVSGPEILERFVGSSEANIRALFDYPPDVPGGGDAEQAEALHVIVLDEFDSIGQRRGGGDDGGDRVRDSVVNQLLARMDGFQELERPTLLVALTNRIDLLDTALLRPGRFEVQVQIPGPDRTGREAILRIHTQRMHQAGRIETPPPDATPASSPPASVGGTGGGGGDGGGYDALVSSLAAVTDGFTGAELAGLVRAAASYALERAVGGAAGGDDTSGSGNGAGAAAADCRVTAEDFGRGLADVARSKSPAAAERPSARGEGALLTPPSAAALIVGGGGGSREEGVGVGTMAGASSDADGEGGGGVRRAGAVGKSKPTATAAAAAASVAAARLDRDIGGSLSREDLESVQKLLLQKTSQKEEEDVLLLDAAQVVAQRRRGGVDGGDKRAETGEGAGGGEGAEGSARRKPKMRRFENTGWFHTYE